MSDLNALNAAVQAAPGANAQVKAWVAAATAQLEPAPVPPKPARWWPDTAWPNQQVPASPTLDPNSAAWAALLAQTCPGGIFPNGQTSGGANSVPVYHADASTPTAQVQTQYQGAVTIPYRPGWLPAAPGDNHFTVLRDDTGWICEFQSFVIGGDGTLSAHMFAAWNIHTSDLAGSIVSILSTVGGLVLASEVAAWVKNGTVPPHALRLALPCGSPGFRGPATRSDGTTPGGIPSGARLWLPRSVSLSGLDSCQTMMARMLQEYGGWHGDSNGNTPDASTFFEAVCDGCSYPWTLTSLPGSIFAQCVVLAP